MPNRCPTRARCACCAVQPGPRRGHGAVVALCRPAGGAGLHHQAAGSGAACAATSAAAAGSRAAEAHPGCADRACCTAGETAGQSSARADAAALHASGAHVAAGPSRALSLFCRACVRPAALEAARCAPKQHRPLMFPLPAKTGARAWQGRPCGHVCRRGGAAAAAPAGGVRGAAQPGIVRG